MKERNANINLLTEPQITKSISRAHKRGKNIYAIHIGLVNFLPALPAEFIESGYCKQLIFG